MTIQLQNNHLIVLVSEKGAELSSIKSIDTGLEYLWQGNSTYWGRQAPVLFPIIGRLINDQYLIDEQIYPMGQHGFARDYTFRISSQSDTNVSLCLTSDSTTKAIYPYDFNLTITYKLEENTVTVTYLVENPNVKEMMYFSIGGHPGFNVPITEDTKFEDYYLAISPTLSRTIIPLKGPYLDTSNKFLTQTTANLALNRNLFDNDAIIYETKGRNVFSIQSDKTEHSISFTLDDFPYVGIWSPPKKDAPFVCIEPWFGIADEVTASGQLKEKLGIQSLEAMGTFSAHYSITIK
ncbi:MAG: aldose epimerase [Firmicutes bacterium HGW-Firmicutes-1]|jgi:galactose mutarotase-like enzyme|nr:MAG: aldose epimerase [Firmicutes bacterium HGW-Firmicutes-1]